MDGGENWCNFYYEVFNMVFVGVIEVFFFDFNVVYVGMGEYVVCGVMILYGDGVY